MLQRAYVEPNFQGFLFGFKKLTYPLRIPRDLKSYEANILVGIFDSIQIQIIKDNVYRLR